MDKTCFKPFSSYNVSMENYFRLSSTAIVWKVLKCLVVGGVLKANLIFFKTKLDTVLLCKISPSLNKIFNEIKSDFLMLPFIYTSRLFPFFQFSSRQHLLGRVERQRSRGSRRGLVLHVAARRLGQLQGREQPDSPDPAAATKVVCPLSPALELPSQTNESGEKAFTKVELNQKFISF
jgi:hypothetical protein